MLSDSIFDDNQKWVTKWEVSRNTKAFVNQVLEKLGALWNP